MRRIVRHELAHYFGISDARLIEIDAYQICCLHTCETPDRVRTSGEACGRPRSASPRRPGPPQRMRYSPLESRCRIVRLILAAPAARRGIGCGAATRTAGGRRSPIVGRRRATSSVAVCVSSSSGSSPLAPTRKGARRSSPVSSACPTRRFGRCWAVTASPGCGCRRGSRCSGMSAPGRASCCTSTSRSSAASGRSATASTVDALLAVQLYGDHTAITATPTSRQQKRPASSA